ncbi:hypothetical protein B0I37DRAFT_310194 [Chaetomium sp. MPI-CAGE-AT-0009]|nr:hypothetical protein B0I37DRAFT_310194 [Chaetomium sp. MPI-CAGE-AT-0009]
MTDSALTSAPTAVASQASSSGAGFKFPSGSVATNTQHDYDVLTLETILDTLRDQRVLGPQLFRIKGEFKGLLGQGADGQVRAIDDEIQKKTTRLVRSKWKAKYVAVKRYGPRKQDPPMPSGKVDAARYMRAAASEVFALAHAGFNKHPNIVQILGWGLCLDSLVDASAPCCGTLHLPLIVMERAVGDFAEFLAFAFRKPVDSESGPSPVTVPRQRRPDPQAAAEAGQYSSVSPVTHKSWGLWGLERYELIRLLCLDIGNGLGALHRERFIHGDLKPENVLIFEGSGRLVAKLCDFGRSKRRGRRATPGSEPRQGQEDDEDMEQHNRGRAAYEGTNAWKPPWFSDDPVSFSQLQKYDIAVYGMVVWSAFCLAGKPPPQHGDFDRFTRTAQKHVDHLHEKTGWVWDFSQISHAGRVRNVIDSTLRSSGPLDLEPWEHLYTSVEIYLWRKGDKDGHEVREAEATRRPWLDTRRILGHGRRVRTQVRLSTIEKDVFNELAYRRENQPGGADETPCQTCHTSHPQNALRPASPATDETDEEPEDETPRHPLWDCLSSISSDADQETDRIHALLDRSPMDFEGGTTMMYCLARFRSAMTLESWQKTPKSNILEKMLKAEKMPDICTLAWLCAGEVGAHEVKTLKAEYTTWKVVLERELLNQSERLERFLLLLQFGARVEAKLEHPVNHETRSVLCWFLLYCNPKTVLTCAGEICDRFKDTHASDSTRDTHRAVAEEPATKAVPSKEPDETTPLLDAEQALSPSPPRRSDTLGLLPKGWQKIKTGSECFEEQLTHSITTIPPAQNVDSASLTTIRIGDWDSGKIFETQLSQFAQPRLYGSGGSNLDVEKELKARFPSYDAKFFISEPERVMPDRDILEQLSRSGSVGITSFAVRIPRFNIILSRLSFAVRVVGNVIFSVLEFFAEAMVPTLGFLLKLAVVLLVLALLSFELWVLFPIIFAFCCIWLVRILLLKSVGSVINRLCCVPLGGILSLIAAIPLGFMPAVRLFDWLCSSAPTGHYRDGTECVECVKCAWYAIDYTRCNLEAASC